LAAVTTPLRPDAATDFLGEPDKSLGGVESIWVQAQVNDKGEVTGTGVTNDWVKQVAELRLRRNGIHILSLDEWVKAKAPYLLILVDGPQAAQAGAPIVIWTQFRQRVMLERAPTIRQVAATWEKSEFGSMGTDFKAGARQTIEDQVDAFSNTFLAQNPKK
jgi:hypothetical protein